VAQTRRRRTRKHRGTPAGTIEHRGRTSRRAPKTKQEKRAATRAARAERMQKPPTWRGSAIRAAVASAIGAALALAVFGQKPVGSIALASVMFLLYIPAGYYMDLFLYRRRQARK
jgi:hypothetical protein